MTVRTAVGVALGGAAGTGLRLAAAAPLPLALTGLGAWRLLAVNVGGAFALGVLRAVSERRPRLHEALPIFASGLLGGLTTFSSMVVAAGRLGHDLGLVAPGTARMTGTGLGLAAAYLLGSLAAGVAALRAGRRLAGCRPGGLGHGADRGAAA